MNHILEFIESDAGIEMLFLYSGSIAKASFNRGGLEVRVGGEVWDEVGRQVIDEIAAEIYAGQDPEEVQYIETFYEWIAANGRPPELTPSTPIGPRELTSAEYTEFVAAFRGGWGDRFDSVQKDLLARYDLTNVPHGGKCGKIVNEYGNRVNYSHNLKGGISNQGIQLAQELRRLVNLTFTKNFEKTAND